MVSIPEIDCLTQYKTIEMIPVQAADLASLILDVPADLVGVNVTYTLPEDVKLPMSHGPRSRASHARCKAVRISRKPLVILHAQGDVSVVCSRPLAPAVHPVCGKRPKEKSFAVHLWTGGRGLNHHAHELRVATNSGPSPLSGPTW